MQNSDASSGASVGATTPTTVNPGTKIRTSCDRCQAAKLKCNRVKPACGRCAKGGHKCLYSPFKRIGRPPKSTLPPGTAAAPPPASPGRGKGHGRKHSAATTNGLDTHDRPRSLPPQDGFFQPHLRPPVGDGPPGCDPTFPYDGAIAPDQLLVDHATVGNDLDMMMHMAGETSWSAALPTWPVHLHTPMQQLPMLDPVMDIDPLAFDMSAALDGVPKGRAAAPTGGLPSPARSQISMSNHAVADNLANAFLWEADLFGGVGVPLPPTAGDPMRHVDESMPPPLTRRASPAASISSESMPPRKRKSVVPDDRHRREQIRDAGGASSKHSPFVSRNSSPIMSSQPLLTHRPSRHGSIHQADYGDGFPRALPIRSHGSVDFAHPGAPLTTPPPSGGNSESGDVCRDECYPAFLAHVMRLVEHDGSDELGLDALLSMNREVIRRRERALRCLDCSTRSNSRATMILLLMALNNLVGMFEQKLNSPRMAGPPGMPMGALPDELAGPMAHGPTDLSMGPHAYPGEDGDKARFLHELISLSLERMVVLLTELEQGAHHALKDASYAATKDMLRDLPRRIFFMKGKLAMAGSGM